MCLYILSLSLSMTNARHKNYLQKCVKAAASTSRGPGKVRRLEIGGDDLHYWCIGVRGMGGGGGGLARVKENTTGSFTSCIHMSKVYPSCSATKKRHFGEQGANWISELIRHLRSQCHK